MPSLLKESLGKPCLMFRPVWFLELELWELQVSVQCPWPGSLCPRPHPSTTPPALTNACCGPPLPGAPRTPRGSSITPTVQMRTAGCALSWSFPGLPTPAQERAFIPPSPGITPPCRPCWGAGGGEKWPGPGQHHSPIVWVPPPALWGFGQVAHPLTHTGEGRHRVPTLWLWEIWWDQQAQHGSVRLSALVQPAPSCAFQARVHPWPPLLHPCPGHLGCGLPIP